MLARPYSTIRPGTFDNSTVTGILEYRNPGSPSSSSFDKALPIFKPMLPYYNDTNLITNFTTKLRSLATKQYPAAVPQSVDRRFFFTIGLDTLLCPKNMTCQGPNGTQFAAAVNNVSLVLPSTALLQSHFTGLTSGVYAANFSVMPLSPFNYTGTPPNNTNVATGTKLLAVSFNTSVELVMQDTSILGIESHPLHLHRFNFFVVGKGIGNYDAVNDPAKFNLVDHIERNTFGVPAGGWVAIRFLADNPSIRETQCTHKNLN
uniref:Plastocyanin-like domain-containing protein n=1 Tax=Hordeum vulgare subsp. vulgare TaxID=112509 RepID=A0A8I6XMF3_HORVV